MEKLETLAPRRARNTKRDQLRRLFATMRRIQMSNPAAFRALTRLARMVEKKSP